MADVREREEELATADRIRKLRGRRPQHVVADAVGVKLRTYQHWEEATATPEWDNLEALASYHGVSANYVLYGEDQPQGPQTQLDRMEAKVDEVLAGLPAPPGALGRHLRERKPKAKNPKRKGPGPGQDGTGGSRG